MDHKVKYLFLGGGVASVNAVVGLRELDSEGSVALAGAETWMPYDRPPLSKAFLTKDLTADDISSKFDTFYPDNKVELMRGKRASRLDLGKKVAHFDDGYSIGFEKLLIATGSRARPLTAPGARHPKVFPLRTIDDAQMIREEMKTCKRVVVVGAGFIGMEVAAALAGAGIETTVLCLEDYPWALFASPKLGKFMQGVFESQGIRFMTRETAAAITDGPEVVTQSGMRLPCDMVVVGAGVDLNVEFALEAGLHGDKTHGITTSDCLQTSHPDVFAAGDVANFYDRTIGRHWHCEHHLNARWQGLAAGANLAGANKPFDKVPYIYSDIFDIHMILRGDPTGRNESVVLGSVNDGEFVELYHDDVRTLRMGIAVSHTEPKLDPIAEKLDALVRSGAKVDDLSYSDVGL